MKRVITMCLGIALARSQPSPVAQAWPSKPIKWIVPFAPGGTTDILARTVGDKLAIALGVPVVVENKPGAGGGVGAEFTAKSAPDGYTIMGGTISTHAINASLYKDLPYDPVKDFVPITLIARVPNMLVVNPGVPAKDVKELIVLLKANPGKYTFASSGNGTSQHLVGRALQDDGRRRHAAHPVQGQPARAAGRRRRPGDDDLRQHHDGVAAREGGQAPRARGDDRASARPSRPTSRRSPNRACRDSRSARGRACSRRPARRPTIVKRLNAEIVKILNMPDVQRKARRARRRARRQLARGVRGDGEAEVVKWADVVKKSGRQGRLSEAGERERDEDVSASRAKPRLEERVCERERRPTPRRNALLCRCGGRTEGRVAERWRSAVGPAFACHVRWKRPTIEPMSSADATLFPGFAARRIATSGAEIHCVVGGSGPPLLLLHGYPQTHAMWHRIAPRLAERFTVVCSDLRGYGDSSKPDGGDDARQLLEARDGGRSGRGDARAGLCALPPRRPRSRRARRAPALPRSSGGGRARCGARHLADADHVRQDRQGVRDRVLPLVLPDPAVRPARAADRRRSDLLPAQEDRRLGRRTRASSIRARSPSTSAASRSRDDPRDVRGLSRRGVDRPRARRRGCRRAARSTCPLLVLWGEKGVVHRLFDPVADWRTVATDVRGRALPSGHYLAEEVPERNARRIDGVSSATDRGARHGTCWSTGEAHPVCYNSRLGQVAQLVEQRTENPCVGGSIPPLATSLFTVELTGCS